MKFFNYSEPIFTLNFSNSPSSFQALIISSSMSNNVAQITFRAIIAAFRSALRSLYQGGIIRYFVAYSG